MREVLSTTRADDLLEPAQLATSELVTNAVVHAGTEIGIRILAVGRALRVEITDGSTRLPVKRMWSATAGTGRGLHVVDQSSERWDVEAGPRGKTVWFEIGHLPRALQPNRSGASPVDAEHRESTVQVILLDMPLLMHRAWQEHAATLLREFLLYTLEADPAVLDDHAAASDALSILDEQLPRPTLPVDPEELMANLVEPTVTGRQVILDVPTSSVPHFAVLDDVLSRAGAAAQDGLLLGPPTQPEIREMRQWLCAEVTAQAAGPATPRPWRARTDARQPSDKDAALGPTHRDLVPLEEPVIATDQRYVIVAATPPILRFLGYRDETELLGRRILVLIPQRYHQAHIAGTTFHATNGRDVLLDRWITVPVVRADGSEVPVELRVEPRRLTEDDWIFVATFRVG
ncbi:hypothetical protein DDE18_09380 [Nocardioides gansuensis]|uniref:PAS domain-containing protein n=1 Tax=Nocardioides gansuensis TaxID=2138300 RepID=A0A2T8FCQ3_9ACTN|nr:PAS domain S-box protein [Nocardioides gansuensis]PVG83479.1 hypothetical protein DDE18_09380 [Nocardioides gansuensis]